MFKFWLKCMGDEMYREKQYRERLYANINKRFTFKSIIFNISKKNMLRHQLYIQRCFELAQLANGKVTPNPKVGAVIVHDGKIIGEGYHQFPGGPHAEIDAFNSLKDKSLLPFCSMYISLEPCNNYGKTPPCVDSILKYKIPEVYISVIDPNPLTMGKSIKKLKAAGVKVTLNVLAQKGKTASPGFFSSILNNRPYVILKYAQSLNKRVGVAGTNFWISNPYTKRLTHKWRSEINAIMVGSRTLTVDNPQLNNRLYYGKSPVKLLLKKDGILPKDTSALYTAGRTIVVSSLSGETIDLPNTTQWKLSFDNNLLKNVLNNLKQEGLNSLLVEGGATLINHFIKQEIWDEARIFTGNKMINHKEGIPAPTINGELVNSYNIGDNLLEVFKNEKSLV